MRNSKGNLLQSSDKDGVRLMLTEETLRVKLVALGKGAGRCRLNSELGRDRCGWDGKVHE